MPLPAFLVPHTISISPAAANQLGGAAPTSSKLLFVIKPQLQTNWCWAAVSMSVSHFYDNASSWTQCRVANSALPRTDCCMGGAQDTDKCNKPWYLDTALGVTGNLRQVQPGRLSFKDVQSEIANATPIGCRVGWYGGGGHFMVIRGWLVGSSGTEYIDVSDPIYLDSQMAYDEFADQYQGGGDWTHVYLTQRSTGGGAPEAVGGQVVAAMAVQFADPEALGA